RPGTARCWCRWRCRASRDSCPCWSAAHAWPTSAAAQASRCSRWRARSRRRASTATTSRTTRSRAPRRTAAPRAPATSSSTPRREPLPGDASFHFVTAFDCLHDMTDPARAIESIRAALRDDGVWLIADIKALDGYEANVRKNPMAALMYGTSVLTCMSSALSEPGGLGLGTLGLHENLLRQMVAEAGFTRFETLDLGHPVNAFYVVRP